jgi:hypothetical protein
MFDVNNVSRFSNDPNGLSAVAEYELAMKKAQIWYTVFSHMELLMGNHDNRYYDVARALGIPDYALNSYRSIYKIPDTWKIHDELNINGVKYFHGSGRGKNAFITAAERLGSSVVIGHNHTVAGVKYFKMKDRQYFGMSVGCGIDTDRYAFKYQERNMAKPVLGCGVVLDGGKTGLFLPFNG